MGEEKKKKKHGHNLSQHALLPQGVMFKRKQNDERLAEGHSTSGYIKLWHRVKNSRARPRLFVS